VIDDRDFGGAAHVGGPERRCSEGGIGATRSLLVAMATITLILLGLHSAADHSRPAGGTLTTTAQAATR
jgi:hypothetical protein